MIKNLTAASLIAFSAMATVASAQDIQPLTVTASSQAETTVVAAGVTTTQALIIAGFVVATGVLVGESGSATSTTN